MALERCETLKDIVEHCGMFYNSVEHWNVHSGFVVSVHTTQHCDSSETLN